MMQYQQGDIVSSRKLSDILYFESLAGTVVAEDGVIVTAHGCWRQVADDQWQFELKALSAA